VEGPDGLAKRQQVEDRPLPSISALPILGILVSPILNFTGRPLASLPMTIPGTLLATVTVAISSHLNPSCLLGKFGGDADLANRSRCGVVEANRRN